jgi:hypothetical protein
MEGRVDGMVGRYSAQGRKGRNWMVWVTGGCWIRMILLYSPGLGSDGVLAFSMTMIPRCHGCHPQTPP